MIKLGAVLFKNGNLILKMIYEQNNIIFTADVQLYLTKIGLGTMWGQTGRTTPGPPLELPLVAPMLLGG